MPKDPSDPYLIEWVKSPCNPIITPNEEEKESFRDPTTAWLGPDDRIWRVVIGNERKNRGTALLYKSEDFIHWTEAERPLHSSNETTMWECPDFFPVSIDGENGLDISEITPGMKHVLKNSVARSFVDYYTVGAYDHLNDIYTPDEGSVDNESGLRLDYGRYYASKSFFDSEKKRRIFIAWVNESTNKEIDLIKGWSGLQVIIRFTLFMSVYVTIYFIRSLFKKINFKLLIVSLYSLYYYSLSLGKFGWIEVEGNWFNGLSKKSKP